MKKMWKWKTRDGEPLVLEGMHPVAGILLAQRGIKTAEDAEKFFRPNWEADIHDPFLFSQMRNAVARVFAALENGERITVHGDYDADGVTGSTVVMTALREIEKKINAQSVIDSYIPHRDEEGYGLHAGTVPVLAQRGTRLLITVDCGIACVDEIALAKEAGIDTIVLDHHRFGDVLPDAILIHPSLPGESYPFKHLAAVGVAWKFASALVTRAREKGWEIPDGWEKWLLDLVAVATVTDMVPLEGENRTLLRYGLLVLNKTRRPGFAALFDAARIEPGSVSSETVGFTLGPRINAAGRMEHASLALELLLAEDAAEARQMASALEALNRQRQKRMREMMDDAERHLLAQPAADAIALHDPSWPPALVGLVAGRVADKYARPCIAVGKHGGQWIGSGRSPEPVDITELVRAAGEGILTRVGGHAQACGFALASDEAVRELATRFVAAAGSIRQQLEDGPAFEIDAELSLADVTWDLWETLERFEPFGIGNPRPLFCTRGLRIVARDCVGAQKNHLRITAADDVGHTQTFIGFHLGERYGEWPFGSRVDVVYDVTVNEWQGQKRLSCRMIDLREAQNP